MKITARVENLQDQHHVTLSTNDNAHPLTIAPRSTGYGSSINGGELLFLALATCYCNDIYREAVKRNIRVESVEVEVTGDFGAEGEPGKNLRYHTKITADAGAEVIRALAVETDRVAEIQNTLRVGTNVTLGEIKALSV